MIISNGSQNRSVAIIGPTAVGKTSLVLQIADQLGGEIVNLDSMQVYRYMDIGTAKPSRKEQQQIRHHLLDIVEPNEEYNLSRYIEDAGQACSDIISRQKVPILIGGTGLYLKGFQDGVFDLVSVSSGIAGGTDLSGLKAELAEELAEKGSGYLFDKLRRYDSESAARIHQNDTYRLLRALLIYKQTGIPWSAHLARQKQRADHQQRRSILKIGLTCPRDRLYARINLRTEMMFEAGLLEEVRGLLDMGFSPELKPMQSIGYRHALKYIFGEWGKDDALEIMARDTRRYAKRQYTWFNKDHEIRWFEPDDGSEIVRMIKAHME